MEIFYYFVRQSAAWEPKFHDNFFNGQFGFIYGLLVALVVAIIAAALFYFGCCNSNKEVKYANKTTWAVVLLAGAIVAALLGDIVIIGHGSDSVLVPNFYDANEQYYTQQVSGSTDQNFIDELASTKTKIASDLDKNNDVRIPFDFTTGVWAAVLYFLISLPLKGITINGKVIPITWPSTNGNKK